ncbi:tRNA lysidine(34) synthetase TilS [Colwellia sp. MSW7]|uniref:tRNA lysidine(34) synthetase TilS n=2 Tax=Colwellia maritima TaxID=2912588 RepID=A0ABS9WZI3_9GAMM|nr:tRNA lysidine(34) synthetase TilS [Colwellia maritima]MCI2283398.1 tRNA lysidine(34) synthetase TilS [Colwellia maritima]
MQKVTLRFSHNNPSCLPDYRNHSRSLKKVLQELNIPTWQRKRIPFLYYDDELVAAIGFFVCQAYVLQESEPSLHITWAS